MKHSLGTCLGFFKVVKKKSPQIRSPDLPEDLCREFLLADIKAATNNFHPDSTIGIGGYGTVYKGTTDDGIVVAVKKLQKSESLQDSPMFRNEVQILCQLRHPHIISLIGLCHQQNEMILVYEYMSRGSLSDYLFGKTYEPLSWKQRLKICIGVARGLHYLHAGAKRAVIHRNVKPSNILLDDEWSSKLADFGLSIIGPPSMSKSLYREHSSATGTVGYIAPEVIGMTSSPLLTDKSDAFSFGNVLFEVLCGRRIVDCDAGGEDQIYLIGWVYQCIKDGTIYQAIDSYLKGKIAPSCLQKFLEIAFGCCILQADKRPALGEVEATLELALELQNRADSETECINPHGEAIHEEVLFSLPSLNYSDYFLDEEDSISTIEDLSDKNESFDASNNQ